MKKRIGIIVLATNSYFILGLRFIRRFHHFYQGDCEIVYYFFSDDDPRPYCPEEMNIQYYHQRHLNWRDGTNSKFKNVVNIQYDLRKQVDYVFYFDADTTIYHPFTEEWFLGESVSAEHAGNKTWLANGVGFDRNPYGKSYTPLTSTLPYTYRQGATFGGNTEFMISFCETLMKYQIIDTDKGYEPPVNDESYLNAYFHVYPPTYTIPMENYQFAYSDKGGYDEYVRHPEMDISHVKRELLENKDKLFNLEYMKVTYGKV